MKHVLIFSHSMELGGAEKALLGLLEAIDKDEYTVDLFLMRHTGELMPYIPKEVRLLPEVAEYACLAVPPADVLQKGKYKVLASRLAAKLSAKKRVLELRLPKDNMIELLYSHKHTLPLMPEIGLYNYDLAVSFLTPHYFVAQKVRAKKKAAWIHTDYGTVRTDIEEELKMWDAYDRIAAISRSAGIAFMNVFPTLTDKVTVVENMIPMNYMERRPKKNVSGEMRDDGTLKLLSVGRFCTAKNFDNVPEICRRLLDKGADITWYLIGFGGDEMLIRKRIEQENVGDRVVILGKKDDPYPYMEACDLYVQPSRYEGKCVSVLEAQILGRPVVITDYPTSSSQLEDGVDGLIVPMGNEACAQAIFRLLCDREKMKSLSEACASRDYSNRNKIGAFYALMD